MFDRGRASGGCVTFLELDTGLLCVGTGPGLRSFEFLMSFRDGPLFSWRGRGGGGGVV